MKEQIFKDFFLYQTPSYIIKNLYDCDKIKNDETMEIC